MTTKNISQEKQLFEYIKNHDYDKVINIIKSNLTLDLNEPDDSGTYLIQYAILFRSKDILALLISRNCRLDVLDNDGRNIFYIPIKYGYLEIVKILINFSNVVIGIPLLEMQDKFFNIPLHYAIQFNRFDIIEDMLAIKFNLNLKDNDGNTALHLIIKYINKDNINIFNLLIERIGINHINNIGQSVLHIAVEYNNILVASILLNNNINPNSSTLNDHLTPILITTIQNNIDMCNLLLKYNIDINCQDVYGNSILMHAIQNKSKQLIELYYDKVNCNLINTSGNIALQLYFKNDYNMSKLDEYFFNKILKKTRLNNQNNEGKTIWHELINNDIWENYIDILKEKKNKIFIQDIENITPYDLIKNNYPEKYDKFMDIIAESFLYNYTNVKTKLKIDIPCLNNNITESEKSKCLTIIKKYIVDNNISVPEIKKQFCVINDINIENINFSSYTGATIDIICGLIYLNKKFTNVQTSLTEDFIINEKIEDYYKINGIQKRLFNEFLNFEIVWSYHKFFYPTTLKIIVNKFKNDSSKQYLIFPIGIELYNGAHANILLYDKNTNTMERYEPYGKDYPPNFNYNADTLDLNIKNLFMNYFNNELIYYSPSSYEQKIGLQLLDTIEYSKEKNIGDPGGFCAAWSLWYVEMRILNHNLSKDIVIQQLINYIRSKKLSFRTVIRNFTKKITDVRDKILTDADIDINKWLNDNYDINNWNNLVELIKKEINYR